MKLWFLAYGLRLGGNQSPLTTVLYAFDGNSFKTRWSRSDLRNGTIKISPDGVHLEYTERAQGDWRDVIEDLDMTPDGLVTRSRRVSREVPAAARNSPR